jgi:hypothetical protein
VSAGDLYDRHRYRGQTLSGSVFVVTRRAALQNLALSSTSPEYQSDGVDGVLRGVC